MPTLRASRRVFPRRGFALIVVMTLLALVVLMILSLVTMVQLSLQASKASVRQAQAQQNALLGVQIAVGQLQKFAGPDQRTSAEADLGRKTAEPTDASTRLATVPTTPPANITILPTATLSGFTAPIATSGGTRHWVGIWGNTVSPVAAFATSNTANPTPVLLNWLVSGNEGTIAFPVDATTPWTYGRIVATAAAPTTFSPAQNVANLTANTTALDGNLTIGGQPAVLLVGPNTTGVGNISGNVRIFANTTALQPLSVSAPARFVAAPLVNLTSNETVVGRLAYWVGDEGVKAKYNLRDRYLPPGNATIAFTNTTMNAVSNITYGQEARYRFLSPPRSALELITATGQTNFSSFANLSANATLSPILDRITRIEQAHSVDTSSSFTPSNLTNANDPVRFRFHDVTTHSYGVLADAQRGGLRYDLTAALALDGIWADPVNGLAGKKILPDSSSSNNLFAGSSLTTSPVKGPWWDTIKSFYDTASQVATAAVEMRAANTTTAGIAPVIVQNRLQFGLYYDAGYRAYIATSAIFVLANPYNFSIRGPAEGLDLQYSMGDFYPQRPSGSAGQGVLLFDSSTNAPAEWGIGLTARIDQNNYQDRSQGNFFTRTAASIMVPGNSNLAYGEVFGRATNTPSGGYFPILKHSSYTAGLTSDRSVLDGVVFRISGAANLTFQPGEVKVFSVGGGGGTLPTPPTFSNAPLPIIEGASCAANYNGVAFYNGTNVNGTNSFPVPLVPNVQANSFFLTETGAQMALNNENWGHLGGLYPAISANLELRAARSPTFREKGTKVYQRIVNMDLTGASTNKLNSGQATPYLTANRTNYGNGMKQLENNDYYFAPTPDSGYRRIYGADRQGITLPRFLGAYMFWLATPRTDNMQMGDPNIESSNATGVFADYVWYRPSGAYNYRTYTDYNLRATNLAFPPFAPFNKATVFSLTSPALNRPPDNQQSPHSITRYAVEGFPTVPPFGRAFYQGVGVYYSNQTTTLSNDPFTRNMSSKTWGYTQEPAGQKNSVLFSFPQRIHPSDVALLSLGQLQHVDLTADDDYLSVSYQPGNAVGNSWFTPFLTRNTAKGSRPRLSGDGSGQNVNVFDMSYLLNASLWDRYFFSAIPYLTPNLTSTLVLPSVNSRLKYATGYVPTAEALGATTPGSLTVTDPATGRPIFKAYAPARYLMIDGAFNVNSTSVEAWKSLLGALRNLALNNDPGVGTPYPRSLPTPTMSANTTFTQGYKSGNANHGNSVQSYFGFRKLTDPEIEALAVNIVNQVRARGPFLSLAHFINRKLGPVSDPATRAGALQSALESSAINQLIGNTASDIGSATQPTLKKISEEYVTLYSDANRGYVSDISSASPTTFSLTSLGNRSTNMPGWLTQADLLQALAPVLAARSDTFLVRAYGDTVDPASGSVQNRVWCEAVVQRMPNFVDDANHPAESLAALSQANKQFGRRFQVVAMRWLNAQDI